MLNKRLHAVLFNLLLAVQSKLALHLQLHRQTVCIPSGLSRHHLTLHRVITRNHILNHTGQHMSDMRLSIRGWRPVIKRINRLPLTNLHTLLKRPVLFPERANLLLGLYIIPIRLYLVIQHVRHPPAPLMQLFRFSQPQPFITIPDIRPS